MIHSYHNIAEAFEAYLQECEFSKGLRPKTLQTYRDVFKNFSNVVPEAQQLSDLQPYIITEFFKRLGIRSKETSSSLKASTVKTYFNKLLVFIRWLERQQLIETMSTKLVKPPNPRYEDEKALSEKAVSKIVSTIYLNTIEDVFMQRRDLVIIYLLLYTGIRRGELLGLRMQDINFIDKTLFVRAETSKSKKSRYIPLHFTLLTHLKAYLSLRKSNHLTCEALIISSKQNKGLTDHGLKHWVTRYNRLSGIAFHTHQFRHTFACNLAKHNADIISIKNVLGHSTTRMTEQYLRSIKTENARLYIDNLTH